MPEYVLFFATLAALASCVKETNLLPEQTDDNLVTIKAVSADTKTVLNGTDVVWEADDAIKVVFNSTEKQYVAEFTTDITGTSATADFSGTLDSEITVATCGETGYAVYPSTVTFNDNGKVKFFLTDSQYGAVQSGKNLSFAEVSLANLRNTATTKTTFMNALSLVKVTVPEGVLSVTLQSTSAALAGQGLFSFENGEINYSPDGANAKYSVTLKNEDETTELDATKTYYVHVFPGNHSELDIKVKGTDCSYERKLAFEFVASKYHALDIANIFSLGSLEYTASPFGDKIEIPVTTTLDEYTVTIPDEATWITKSVPVKGAFRKETISLDIAKNTGSEDRSAVVTVSGGENLSYDVTISQKKYDAALLDMELKESYTKSNQQLTGTLKIAKTDDASKGVYKVTICGVSTYADYKAPILTVHDGGNDYEFTVATEYTKLTYTGDGSLFLGSGEIFDYEAVKSLGPAVLSAAEQALVGDYDETWTYGGSVAASAMGMNISASTEALYGQLYVKCLTYDGYSFTGYASYNEDDKILTVNVGKQQHGFFNKKLTLDVVITMTVNDNGTLSFDSWKDGSYEDITNYTATKVVDEGDGDGGDSGDDDATAVVPADLVGGWNETFRAGGSYSSDKMTIALTDDADKGQLKVKMFNYTTAAEDYYLECYADLSDDGKTLTVLTSGVNYATYGAFSENMVMTVSGDGKTITYNSTINTIYTFPVGNLTATKVKSSTATAVK